MPDLQFTTEVVNAELYGLFRKFNHIVVKGIDGWGEICLTLEEAEQLLERLPAVIEQVKNERLQLDLQNVREELG